MKSYVSLATLLEVVTYLSYISYRILVYQMLLTIDCNITVLCAPYIKDLGFSDKAIQALHPYEVAELLAELSAKDNTSTCLLADQRNSVDRGQIRIQIDIQYRYDACTKKN